MLPSCRNASLDHCCLGKTRKLLSHKPLWDSIIEIHLLISISPMDGKLQAYNHLEMLIMNLLFSNFEDVGEYNSALHRIASGLKLCGRKITENDMIEKTLSTMHPRNLQLHRQYRAAKYDKYSDLLSTLKMHERSNLLPMKGR